MIVMPADLPFGAGVGGYESALRSGAAAFLSEKQQRIGIFPLKLFFLSVYRIACSQ